jgi:uncharacterized protein
MLGGTKIAEHIVAQELLTINNLVSAKRNYMRQNKEGSEAGVDFIVAFDDKLIPVEVKSGNNAHLRSLHLFMDQAPHTTAVRVWSQSLSVDAVKTPAGKEFNLINLPFHYLGVLELVLEKFK